MPEEKMHFTAGLKGLNCYKTSNTIKACLQKNIISIFIRSNAILQGNDYIHHHMTPTISHLTIRFPSCCLPNEEQLYGCSFYFSVEFSSHFTPISTYEHKDTHTQTVANFQQSKVPSIRQSDSRQV